MSANTTLHGHSEWKKKETDRRKGRQVEEKVGNNIKEWSGIDFSSSARAAKTEQGGKGLLRSHLWCPDDLPGLWDRIPYKFYVLGQIGLSKQCRPRSDQGLRCLPFHQRLLDALMQCYIKLFYF